MNMAIKSKIRKDITDDGMQGSLEVMMGEAASFA